MKEQGGRGQSGMSYSQLNERQFQPRPRREVASETKRKNTESTVSGTQLNGGLDKDHL